MRPLRRRPGDRSALHPDELVALVRCAASDVGSWRALVRVPVGSDRWWTRLPSDETCDMWLLSWLPGSTTELHDHGSSAAAFTVVLGSLSETRVDSRGRAHELTRLTGDAIGVRPGALHDVKGAGDGMAVSIHAYSPPLAVMNYYVPSPDGPQFARRVLTDEPEHDYAAAGT